MDHRVQQPSNGRQHAGFVYTLEMHVTAISAAADAQWTKNRKILQYESKQFFCNIVLFLISKTYGKIIKNDQ